MVLSVSIKIRGLERVQRLLMNFPNVMFNETDKALERFSKAVVNSARRRAPHATGFLSSQINFKKTKKGNFIIDTGEAYYALAIERGFRAHPIPSEYIKRHRTAPGVPGGALGRVANPKWITVQKGPRPFMKPAFESELAKLRTKWSSIIKNAINKSRR